jgi:mRNA-degrading endonuclease toxin of MazEF toxin-antitoxin module
LSSDLILDPTAAEYASTNLKTKSDVRLHKLATIHRRSITRRLGALRPTVVAEVDQKLRALLGL